jgi:hypothetical protein
VCGEPGGFVRKQVVRKRPFDRFLGRVVVDVRGVFEWVSARRGRFCLVDYRFYLWSYL